MQNNRIAVPMKAAFENAPKMIARVGQADGVPELHPFVHDGGTDVAGAAELVRQGLPADESGRPFEGGVPIR